MEMTVHCPGCGRTVAIPQDLPVCFCTYCGAKVERPAAGAVPAPDWTDTARALSALMAADRRLGRQFAQGTYEAAFREHGEHLAAVLAPVEDALPAELGRREQALGLLAEAWLDALEERWAKKSHGKPPVPHYEDQHLMAVFTVPALRLQSGPWGEDLARAVVDRWLRRWPQAPIGLGSYEEIASGFQKKLCFITGAVCRQQGKPDDCYELTAFRRFRDQVLLPTEEGRALVEEYYRLAPAIVASVALCWDAEAVYGGVYRDYLLPCLHRLEAGDAAGCRDKYVEMVRSMERTYLPS